VTGDPALRDRIRDGLRRYGMAADAPWCKFPELVTAVERIVTEEIATHASRQIAASQSSIAGQG